MLWLTVALGLALDLATKSFGWALLGGPPETGGHELDLIPDWLRLVASCNPGIVFGINFGDSLGLGPVGGRILTVCLTLLTSALIFYIFAASRPEQRWLHLACGLILAGALGNLYDRLFFGFVRDIIHFTAHGTIGSWTIQWPYVFNVADAYLVVGVIVIAIIFMFGRTPEAPAAKAKR
ncbi:MAG: signal peptidase II [Planctomycetota bacterium]|nr:signal peptidase II [Planctomycetota bacterium]